MARPRNPTLIAAVHGSVPSRSGSKARMLELAASRPGMTSGASAIVEADIAARLGRLPWGRFHTLVVTAPGVTWRPLSPRAGPCMPRGNRSRTSRGRSPTRTSARAHEKSRPPGKRAGFNQALVTSWSSMGRGTSTFAQDTDPAWELHKLIRYPRLAHPTSAHNGVRECINGCDRAAKCGAVSMGDPRIATVRWERAHARGGAFTLLWTRPFVTLACPCGPSHRISMGRSARPCAPDCAKNDTRNTWEGDVPCVCQASQLGF